MKSAAAASRNNESGDSESAGDFGAYRFLEELRLEERRLTDELSKLRQTILYVDGWAKRPRVSRFRAEPNVGGATPKASRQRRGSAPKPNAATSRRGKTQTIGQAVRSAVLAQMQPWTIVDIRAFLDSRTPEISTSISAARLSQELYAARKRGVVKIQSNGGGGVPHTYVTIHT